MSTREGDNIVYHDFSQRGEKSGDPDVTKGLEKATFIIFSKRFGEDLVKITESAVSVAKVSELYNNQYKEVEAYPDDVIFSRILDTTQKDWEENPVYYRVLFDVAKARFLVQRGSEDKSRGITPISHIEVHPIIQEEYLTKDEKQAIRIEFKEYFIKNRSIIFGFKEHINAEVLRNAVGFFETHPVKDLWESIKDENIEKIGFNKPDQYVAVIIALAKKLFKDVKKPSYYNDLVSFG